MKQALVLLICFLTLVLAVGGVWHALCWGGEKAAAGWQWATDEALTDQNDMVWDDKVRKKVESDHDWFDRFMKRHGG